MSYTELASEEVMMNTSKALTEHNFETIFVETKEEALAKIKELIPKGASVMNGSSTTLQEIGFIDYLKEGEHDWNNLHDAVLREQDKDKQALLRKQSVISDYYLGSAHAVTETGEIVVASNSGSQLPHIAFTSPNVILVAGTQKIVRDMNAAFARIENYVVSLEDERMKKAYGFGTAHSKTLILHKENSAMGRKVSVIFVNEQLGF
jgi:L-lactate utilization protein LutC